MNRPLVYPLVLLITALFLDGCGPQTRAEARQNSASTPISTPPADDAPANQQIDLLPTVTPTPGAEVTPTPTHLVLNWPTAQPELYPMPTPNVYDTEDLARRGISYTVRTDAGFGLFPFNDLSPCLCQQTQNADACRAEIEQFQRSAHDEGIVSTEQCLSIDLADDRLATFHDVNNMARSVSYRYAKAYTDINYHLLSLGYWEGWEYLLVDGATGSVTVISAPPVFSPDKRRFAIPFFQGFGSTHTYLQIWSFDDNTPRFEQGWRIEGLREEMNLPQSVLAWWSADRFHLHWPTHVGQIRLAALTVALGAEGWEVYQNDKPITQPIVEYESIRFVILRGNKNDLDALKAGKPVYTDRDYLFTSIPAELEGATYFRIPQYYYVEPQYFSIEQQMGNYLEFQVTGDASVCVALDTLVDELPDWMQSGWQAVEMKLETDDVPLRLYRKEYPAGATVELVSAWMLDRLPSQLVVIVTPAAE